MSKVIDTRQGSGDLVVLGKAVVLPSSSTDGPVQPMDGSLRFNPEQSRLEFYSDDEWHPIEPATGNLLTMNPLRILGRVTGSGQPEEIIVGEGLKFSGASIATSLSDSSFFVHSATHNGLTTNAIVIPLGIVTTNSTVSSIHTTASALVAASAPCRFTLKKKTANTSSVVAHFDWASGATEAVLTMVAPSLLQSDVLWLEGPATADTSLAHLAFLVMT